MYYQFILNHGKANQLIKFIVLSIKKTFTCKKNDQINTPYAEIKVKMLIDINIKPKITNF